MSSAIASIKGSLFLIFESVGFRLIGLASTLILARVLTPEDFGIVAIAMLFLGLFEVLGSTGGREYLLKTDNLTDQHINTNFTLNIIIQTSLALVFIMVAPVIAYYYDDNRLTHMIQFLALSLLLKAIQNPSEVYLRKKHEYKKIIQVSIISKIISATTTISIVVMYQSYWGLLIGYFTNIFCTTAGSYIIQPYRPKFTMTLVSEQWQFSAWMIPHSILGYFRSQLDIFLVSASYGKDALGSYHVLKYFSYLPLSMVITPATQPLLVELSTSKHDSTNFHRQFNIGFIGTMLLAVPIATMLFINHELIVNVLLGEKWVKHSELLSLLALLIPSTVMLQQANRVLIVYGKTKTMFNYEITSFILLYSTLYFIGLDDIFLFTTWRVSLEAFFTFSYMTFVGIKYTTLYSYLKVIANFLFIISTSALSVLSANALTPSIESSLLLLLIICLYSIFIFSLTVSLSYIIFGRKIGEWSFFYQLFIKIINKKEEPA